MNLFDRSSLALNPDGAKDGKLYSIRPTDGSGDFTFSRGSNLAATRVDENGLIEKGRENFLLESNNFDEVWNKSSSNVTSSQAGYDGTADAWSVSKTAQFGRLEQTVVLSGLTTMSVYAKASTNDWIAMRHSADGSSIANFDLTNGVFGAIGSNVVATNSVSVGSGWYRVSVIWNYTGSSGVRIHPSASDNIGGTTATIFIQDVQVEQGLVATDYMDTSTGVNKLLYSNNFEKSAWPVGTHYTVTPDQEGHDGTTNAYLLNKTSGGNDYFRQMDVNVDGQATTSIYAKAGTVNHLMIYLNGYIRVNLNNGDVESTGGVFESYNVERIGRNGWWRISLTIASHPNFVYFKPQIGNNVDGIGSIYIQHAQTNEGADTLPYVETQGTTAYAGVLEDLPRIDYSGGTPSLLLEPSRTNLIPNSEYFDSWTTLGNGTVTQNYGISPEGVQNSSRFQAVTSSDRVYIGVGSVNANETFSVYMKGSGPLLIDIGGGGNNFYPNLTSEWVRYEFTTSQNGTNSNIQFKGNNGTLDVELYGAQFERNSYPTSYIPTYGATATRSDDYYSNTSLSNIGSTDRCTFYCEIDLPQGREGSPYFLRFDSPASSFGWKGNYVPSPIISVIGTGNITNSDTITVSTGVHKLIIRWENGVASIFIDGTKKTEQVTSSATEVFDEFRSQGTGYRHLQKSVLVFPETLSDAECITLTT